MQIMPFQELLYPHNITQTSTRNCMAQSLIKSNQIHMSSYNVPISSQQIPHKITHCSIYDSVQPLTYDVAHMWQDISNSNYTMWCSAGLNC